MVPLGLGIIYWFRVSEDESMMGGGGIRRLSDCELMSLLAQKPVPQREPRSHGQTHVCSDIRNTGYNRGTWPNEADGTLSAGALGIIEDKASEDWRGPCRANREAKIYISWPGSPSVVICNPSSSPLYTTHRLFCYGCCVRRRL
jgi:hypothetical protein